MQPVAFADDEHDAFKSLPQALHEQATALGFHRHRFRVGARRDGLQPLRERHHCRRPDRDVDFHRVARADFEPGGVRRRGKEHEAGAQSRKCQPLSHQPVSALSGWENSSPNEGKAPRIERTRLHPLEADRYRQLFVTDGQGAGEYPSDRVHVAAVD